jgi:hypothetical protein
METDLRVVMKRECSRIRPAFDMHPPRRLGALRLTESRPQLGSNRDLGSIPLGQTVHTRAIDSYFRLVAPAGLRQQPGKGYPGS